MSKPKGVEVYGAVEFKMHNLPRKPWKKYWVIRTDEFLVTFSSLPPSYLQANAEHVEYTFRSLGVHFLNGDVRHASPSTREFLDDIAKDLLK